METSKMKKLTKAEQARQDEWNAGAEQRARNHEFLMASINNIPPGCIATRVPRSAGIHDSGFWSS